MACMCMASVRHTQRIHSYVYALALLSTCALFIAVYRNYQAESQASKLETQGSWTNDFRSVLPNKVIKESIISSTPNPLREDFRSVLPSKGMKKPMISSIPNSLRKDFKSVLPSKVMKKPVTSSTPNPFREDYKSVLRSKVLKKPVISSTPDPLREAEEMVKKFVPNRSSPARNSTIPRKRPDFIPISGLGSILFVHAALWKGDNVRVSLVKSTYINATDILCVLWYSSKSRSNFSVVKAVVTNLMNYYKNVSDAYLKCDVKTNNTKQQFNQSPLYVGLVHVKNLTAGIRIVLPVENRHMNPDAVFEDDMVTASRTSDKLRDKQSKSGLGKITSHTQGNVLNKGRHKARVVDFTVCIPPMFKYNKAAQLVEKLEMVRLLGARRVVLYKFYVRQNVDAVLDMYTREWAAGRETMEVIVHSWNVPQIKLHYHGQPGAIDDCLHRYGWLSRYVVFDDLDELMIPFRHANWSDLIEERVRLHPNSAAFMFRCSIMNNDHLSIAKGFQSEASRFGSSVFSLTQRDDFVWSPFKKSKVIVDPRKVESVGVHHIQKGYGPTDVIPPDLGLLYHYRWPFRPCATEVKDDRVATKFGKQLVRGLKSAWAKLQDVQLGWKRPLPATNTTRPSCAVKAKPM